MGNYMNRASEAHETAEPNIRIVLSTNKEAKMALMQDCVWQVSIGRVTLSNSSSI